MAALAMTSVGLWTLRVAIAARGMKLAGAAVAAVEAIVFALSFSHLVADLDSPGRLLGYAAGVAAGTSLGLFVNDRMAPGHTELHLVVSGQGEEALAALRARGWPTTSAPADGPWGPATQVWITVGDELVPALVGDVTELSPESFWTLRKLRSAHPSPLPPGCRPVRTRRAV